jgi:hypothetical protein
MKYYLDTEFIEGKQDKKILGIKYGETPFTIDLISIGIVSEDGREYYAISKDFNLKEAWNRFQYAELTAFEKYHNMGSKKVYWLRDNVLKPIWIELFEQRGKYTKFDASYAWDEMKDNEKYVYLKMLLLKYGKTNKQIAEEIQKFCKPNRTYDIEQPITIKYSEVQKPEFYGYYADYDWVVFCWLFGKMIDLPKGFPMYCKDLKQIADEIWEKTGKNTKFKSPKNEHNALSDAKWNKELYKFLTNL